MLKRRFQRHSSSFLLSGQSQGDEEVPFARDVSPGQRFVLIGRLSLHINKSIDQNVRSLG